MTPRPIDPHVDPHRGSGGGGPGVGRDAFREALSHWASTVTLVAVRDEEGVHATTVTSFLPVSVEPPLVALSLGPGAQVLPYLDPGVRFVVSFLSESQRGLAVRYTDSFPVGPSPFPAEGDPVIEGAVGALVCAVRNVHHNEGSARLVVARVDAVVPGSGAAPLLYHRRGYRGLAAEE